MTASLRPFARSRCLRVIGVFAWLMLVTTSLAAAPMGTQAQDAQSIHAAASTTAAHCRDDGPASDSAAAAGIHHQAGCCGGWAVPSCHCAAMCASAVPATLALIAAMPLSAGYDMPSRLMAPSPNTAVPLRPPAI